MQFFGENWGAPMLEEFEQIATPVGEPCIHCEEPIAEGDQGIRYGNGPYHRECGLRVVMGGIGHLVDHDRYCRQEGPDGGLTPSQSSLMVWAWFKYGARYTVEDIEALKETPDA